MHNFAHPPTARATPPSRRRVLKEGVIKQELERGGDGKEERRGGNVGKGAGTSFSPAEGVY